MLSYIYDPLLVEISESKNAEDVTFLIKVKSDKMRERVKQLRTYFEDDEDPTDAMFYTHEDGQYEVIVRNSYYEKFLLHAFYFKCLKSLTWLDE